MSPLEAVGLIGLDAKFVENEVKMIESFTTGAAIVHHLEPSYFAAMARGLDRLKTVDEHSAGENGKREVCGDEFGSEESSFKPSPMETASDVSGSSGAEATC